MPSRRISFDLASPRPLHSRKTIKQFHCAHSHPRCKCTFVENKQTMGLLMRCILCLRSLCAFMQHLSLLFWLNAVGLPPVWHLNYHICTDTSKGSSLRLELGFLSSPTFFWGPLGVGGASPCSWYRHSSFCCLRLSPAKVKKCRPPEWWKWGRHVWMETYIIQGQSRWRHEHHESRLKNIFWAGWGLIKRGLRQLFAEVWVFNSVFWFMRSDKSQRRVKITQVSF